MSDRIMRTHVPHRCRRGTVLAIALTAPLVCLSAATGETPAASTQPADRPPAAEEAPKADFFNLLKNIDLTDIDLTDGLTVSLGGEIRGRVEAVTHKLYGAELPTQDTFFLHRYLYHADFKYRQLGRFFIQGTSAWVEDRDGTPMPNPEDRFDVHQMFLDMHVLGDDVPFALRFGRQEMSYGKQRLVSPLGWANVQRTWDGIKLFWQDANWNVDAWYARPVEIVNRDVDNYSSLVHFYGLYTTYKGIENHAVDAYFLALRNVGDVANSNLHRGDAGDLSLYTMGTRFGGVTPIGLHAWDYDTEFAGQWGKSAGDTIQAWMWAADTGYTLGDWPGKPRIGIGVDYASGDDDPYDDIHGTFNQLFPLGHAYFGYLDQIARQNVWAQNLNLTVKPHKSVTSRLAWHTFWADKDRDALYNVAGVRTPRRSPKGGIGEEIGHELDLTVLWKLDVHASFLFGYSHFWTSDFLAGTGPTEDPDLFYVQYRYQF